MAVFYSFNGSWLWVVFLSLVWAYVLLISSGLGVVVLEFLAHLAKIIPGSPTIMWWLRFKVPPARPIHMIVLLTAYVPH